MNILIVDDVGYSRRSLEMVLERAGHQAVQAKSGNEAIAALKANHDIEAVITDLLMPDMDGVDLFLQANKLERFNDQGKVDLPGFILLTSAQEGRSGTTGKIKSRLSMAQDIGFAVVLHKPLVPEAIYDVLDQIESEGSAPVVDVISSINQIQSIIQSAINNNHEEAALELLGCLEAQDRMLREFVANKESLKSGSELSHSTG
jgi:CheY-like chemotaxis protein